MTLSNQLMLINKIISSFQKRLNKISICIAKSRRQLNELIFKFDTLEINDQKFIEIKSSVAVIHQKIDKILPDYENSLIGNRKNTFVFEQLPIEGIFGRLSNFEVNLIIFVFS